MTQIRINGLVAAARQLREAAARTLVEGERERLEAWRVHTLSQLRGILARHGCGPSSLSPQSREALRFLEGFQWAGAAAPACGADAPRERVLKLTRIPSLLRQSATVLWQHRVELGQSAVVRKAQAEQFAQHARGLLERCHEIGCGPEVLAEDAAVALAVHEVLSEPDFLERAGRFLSALGKDLCARLGADGVFVVLALPQSSVWSARGVDGRLEAKIHFCLLAAEAAVGEALARCLAQAPHPGDRYIVREGLLAPLPRELQARLALSRAEGESESKSRGLHKDLRASFDRVVAELFPDGLAVPDLRWSMDGTRRRFGCYDIARDRVTISRTLDDPTVPDFVLDFVLYHELLHKVLGRSAEDGNRYHSRAFRDAERRFPRFDEAEARLLELSRRP